MAKNIADLQSRLEGKVNVDPKDTKTADHLIARIKEIAALPATARAWTRYRNFWPPTVINALRSRELLFFMGAGTSAAAALPTWRGLLEQRLGVRKDFLDDEYLKTDNLTLGELASRMIGREQLQTLLRTTYGAASIRPTVMHYALAALELPVYITTNYDVLFERAWSDINPSRPLQTICNSSDISKHSAAPNTIIKIHGCVSRKDEMLVLTRSEYRQHYRLNFDLFENVRVLIGQRPTVFIGFSHTDPEVGRLIDDVIYRYEKDAALGLTPSSPDLYNMQFENNYVTNERFAAKGMVSLSVRLLDDLTLDARTGGASEALAELVDASDVGMDGTTSVSTDLSSFMGPIKADLIGAISELESKAPAISALIAATPTDVSALTTLLAGIDVEKALATQGLFVLDEHGQLVARAFKVGLDDRVRDAKIAGLRRSFSERPYFQKAKSFRRAFVSDFFSSVFNDNSTFAICVPLLDANKNFAGLLFGACQVGQWRTPIDCLAKVSHGLGAYVLDNQGLVALPPNSEFSSRPSLLMPSESDALKTGFNFTELKILSRKDRLISRLAENIVPVEKDDDVVSLDKDLEIYARIENLGDLGWRCAISRTIKFSS